MPLPGSGENDTITPPPELPGHNETYTPPEVNDTHVPEPEAPVDERPLSN
jgi:hypothetical protein